ncbi:MAG: DUF3857 domain-containing protein [Bryobacterales bacterium]
MRFARILPALAAVLALTPVARAVDWAPITPEELALQKPKIDPNADAEALFWEVWISDQSQGDMIQNVKTHYVRVKIFTERGVESQSTVDLTGIRGLSAAVRIHDLRARTIKPDGAIVDLEKDAVFERDVAKAGGVKVLTRSFSMPNVEPGDIIEYQWREFTDNTISWNERLYFQRDIPAWRVTYHVRPHPRAGQVGLMMRSQAFNVETSGFKQEPQDFWGVSALDMPAFVEESYMPPEDEVRSWMLIFYTRENKADVEKFWNQFGKDVHKEFEQYTKADGGVKKKAAELTAGAADDEQKLAKILDFCRNEIRNPFHDRFGVSAEERASIKDNRNASDTLKNMQGTGFDINMLFAALLQSAGLDARPVMTSRRDGRFFNINFLDRYFLKDIAVGVRIGEGWRFFDLAYPYAEPGMLNWAQEGVAALIPDSKAPTWEQTPMSAPERTTARRTGDFTLLPDGTLEGTVRFEYTGHYGATRKIANDGRTEQERIDAFTEGVTNRLSTAEVSEMKFENVDSLDAPFIYSYKVRIPGYATMTGKRMFFQPNFFERNVGAAFTTSERIHDIYFRHGWRELDTITIQLPKGMEFEEASAPEGTNIQNVGHYNIKISITPEGKLIYARDFLFGQNGTILFPKTSYSQLKGLFDFLKKQDDHVLTLREASTAAQAN